MYEYGAAFYSFLDSFALRSAQQIVPIITGTLNVASVADFGCGQGAWLQAWAGTGACITGIDGPYVDHRRLLVPASAFVAADLAAPLDLGSRFDLVQSLEVAEHLPGGCAGTFIDTLARHGDAILFSAAVPGQGGEHHVNERPLEYWRGLFAARGYHAIDLVRPAVRGDAAVQRWYRCNIVLYANSAGLARLGGAARAAMVPDGQALASYWPLKDRIRQSLVRTLPVAAVDRLSALNSAMIARRLAS